MNKVYPFLHRNPTSGLVTQHDGIDQRLWVATHIARTACFLEQTAQAEQNWNIQPLSAE